MMETVRFAFKLVAIIMSIGMTIMVAQIWYGAFFNGVLFGHDYYTTVHINRMGEMAIEFWVLPFMVIFTIIGAIMLFIENVKKYWEGDDMNCFDKNCGVVLRKPRKVIPGMCRPERY